MPQAGAESPIVLTPSSAARPLAPHELDLLRHIGRGWSAALGERGDWVDAFPVDPELVPPNPSELSPTRFGGVRA